MFFASCGSGNTESKKDNTATEQTANAKYQCPMKCEGEKTYDKPGQCPVCNMDLKKLEDTHEHENHSDTTNHQH
jgi:hypothetical protein